MHVHSKEFGEGQGRKRAGQNKEEETAPSAPARASAHKRRVFVSLDSCVVPYFSLELVDVLLLSVCIRWRVQFSSVVSS